MSIVTICYRNILETSTVVCSPAQNDSYPLYRTYDRDIGKLFKFGGYATQAYIYVAQGATTYLVDRLIVPAGHDLVGRTCGVYYSTNGIDWNPALAPWSQPDNLTINKSFTVQTKQYWLFDVGAHGWISSLPEVYLTKDYVFERNVRIGLTEKHQRNVYREEALSGKVRLVKNGLERRARKYTLLANSAQRTSLQDWNTVYDGTKMFYVIDHTGTLIYMEMLNDLEFEFVSNEYSNTTFDLLEVL